MGTRRLAETEFDFLIKLHSLFNKGLGDDKSTHIYIQIPGDSRMFTQIGVHWRVVIDGVLWEPKSYEVDEILDAIHADGVNVYSGTMWNIGTRIQHISTLHDCHNRGWRKTV